MSLPPEATLEARVNIEAITDVGKVRTHNEDNFIVCPNLCKKEWYLSDPPVTLTPKGCLLVVADGMGGTNAGEVASAIAVDTIKERFDSLDAEGNLSDDEIQQYLKEAILQAHNAIVTASQQNPAQAGMGTTVVLAWVFSHKAFIAWVGDSRAYLHNEQNGLKLLTADHSLVWEMVEAGKLTPEEADVHPQSNIITQSLGSSQRVPKPGFTSCALQQGDRLMLCSDGLNNMVTHKSINKILSADTPLAAACQKLVKAANDAGGVDNTTVLALEVLGKPRKKQRFRLFGIFSCLLWCCLTALPTLHMPAAAGQPLPPVTGQYEAEMILPKTSSTWSTYGRYQTQMVNFRSRLSEPISCKSMFKSL